MGASLWILGTKPRFSATLESPAESSLQTMTCISDSLYEIPFPVVILRLPYLITTSNVFEVCERRQLTEADEVTLKSLCGNRGLRSTSTVKAEHSEIHHRHAGKQHIMFTTHNK